MNEIERKFLLANRPQVLSEISALPIRQGYLAVSSESEVRIRSKGEQMFLTVKSGRGLIRAEHEIVLDPDQFRVLWPATEGKRLEKNRYPVPVPGGVAEVDIYGGRLSGLMTAEVEFKTKEEARRFAPPPWFDDEVTEDDRFANRNLAVNGLPKG